MRTYLSCFIATTILGGLTGCGGSTSATPDAGQKAADEDSGVTVDARVEEDTGAPGMTTPDAAAEAGAMDHGAPSTTYPAFTPDVGQITQSGGLIMSDPVIVAITWDSDPSQASFDTFVDSLGTTNYWSATTKEYGVGPLVSGATNHVHIATAAPAQITDAELQSLVQANAGVVSDAGPGWPAATPQTVYAFFLPPTTSLQLQSMGGGGTQDACQQGIGGYHDQVTVGSGITSYAAVPSCAFPNSGNTAAQQSTMSMSHELIEAATDPEPQQNMIGYSGFDNDHFAFDYFQEFQSEVGDACEFFLSSFYEDVETTPVAFDAWVQRTWSNASIKAAHDPCVPAPAGVAYFNVTPLDLQTVHVTIPAQLSGNGTQVLPTRGILAPTGNAVTFAVGFYSDGPTGGPWTLAVGPGNPIIYGTQNDQIDSFNASTLTATLDRTSGQNGEKAYVTVKVSSPGGTFAGEIITLSSSMGGVTHYMPIWIAQN
jgi:hypothetical protein